MDRRLLRIFQRQVLLQCKFLLFAAQDVNTGLGQRNTERTFYAIQNMLNAGANIAKALWGGGGKKELERKPLRDSVGIGDDSPLKQVTMRNNFEHFDERLDRWWGTTTNRNYADLSIISSHGGAATPGILAANDCFREFNCETTDLVFWGQKFNLNDIVGEVAKIMPRLEAEVEKFH